MNKILLYLISFTIISCQVSVPEKVNHTGTITTENTIKIELILPDTISSLCENECGNDSVCVNDCIAEQEVLYVNAIMQLISEYNIK